MKNNILIIIVSVSVLICGCNQPMPKEYGVYAVSSGATNSIPGQRIKYNGNIMQVVTGIPCAAGPSLKNLKYVVVYKKDVYPNMIRLCQLEFRMIGTVQSVVGDSTLDLRFYTKVRDIPIELGPVDSIPGMYKVTPRDELGEGFYAIHFGGMEMSSPIEVVANPMAYDFVVGDAKQYASYDDMVRRSADLFNQTMDKYLIVLNNSHNKGDFEPIRKIYRPSGNKFTDESWEVKRKEFMAWRIKAGLIKSAQIVSRKADLDSGIYELKTNYEKVGIQEEKVNIRKIGEEFVISDMQ
jgi:hypothetical protein